MRRPMMTPVLLLLLGLTSRALTFDPGCSFSSGQCIYNVKLGHEQQCDTPAKRQDNSGSSTGTVTGFQSCSCRDIDAVNHNVDSLFTSMSTLQNNFDALAKQYNVTQTQLGMKASEVNSLYSMNHNLTAMLVSKEGLLNKTKVELANTVATMNKELDSLRKQLIDTTNQLAVCQAGVTSGTGSSVTNPVLYSNYDTHYCDFEASNYCGYTPDPHCTSSGNECWYHGSGRQNTVSGPIEDHTYGSPHGHYMYIDPLRNPQYSSSHSSSSHYPERKARLYSPEFPPARHYCVRFWYTMYGTDIQNLRVYARVGSGDGYPIWEKHGQEDKFWHMAQIQLTSEYTSSPFKIVLEGETSSSYYHPYSSHTTNYNYLGYIAFDDVFVYNTSCKDIPTCPANARKFTDATGNSSCYTFHVTPKSWYDAVETCKMEAPNGHLVSVGSQKEQDFIVDTLQNDASFVAAGVDGWYTSGNDEATEAHFMWTDTGYPYPVNYTNWAPLQPNNVGNVQDCLLLQYQDDDYEWGDVNCADSHPFICEIKM